MCDSDNIEVVGIRKGDTLVFFVDTDYYDLEDIYEESWYAECDFEYDEDNDEANESVDEEDKYSKYELNVSNYGSNL